MSVRSRPVFAFLDRPKDLQPCCDGTSGSSCWLILDKMVQDLVTMRLVLHLHALRLRCDETLCTIVRAAPVGILAQG